MGYNDDYDNDDGGGYHGDGDHCSDSSSSWEGHAHVHGDDPDEPYSWFEGNPTQQQEGRGGGRWTPSRNSGPRYSSNDGGCLIFIVTGPVLAILFALTVF